jgi:hypothetical protein
MFFEPIECDGPGVFQVRFSNGGGEDALGVAAAQLRYRVLDSASDVACTSCNFESSDDGESDLSEG